ncbi:MAG: phosphatase PAP2 family protein [Alphaproteobacteria bacterium]|nr:phosphatase PAP2 family protein [Alphaproteobacteria bacterium]
MTPATLLARCRARPALASFIAVALFCVVAMVFVDRPLALWLKANLHPHWEGFFKIVTVLGESRMILVPSGAAWLWFQMAANLSLFVEARTRWRRRANAALFVFLAVAGSGLIVNAAKLVIGRIRPRHLFEDGVYGFQPFNFEFAMNTFPSGHAQSIWAAMIALAIVAPRYDLAWLAIAALVGISRFVTTVHFLSDVAMGTWIGIVFTLWLRREFERRNRPVAGGLQRWGRVKG